MQINPLPIHITNIQQVKLMFKKEILFQWKNISLKYVLPSSLYMPLNVV